MPSERYRLICIVDSFQNGDQTPSMIDASPDYLHIHILKSAQLQTIDNFSSKLSDKTENEILFQWGIPLEKDARNRSEKVSTLKVREFGNVGLGSAARGHDEQVADFIGGGEGFLFDDQNFRITKGNTAFEAQNEQTYWTFQVTDFNGARKIGDLNGLTIGGRNQLMQALKEKSEDKPFVAVFDAQFEENLFARSNGIFPEDLSQVSDSKQALFISDVMGGHLVGGSKNQGDVDSLRQVLSESEANQIDFTLTIKSEVILKPINELQIAKLDGSFRKPRTAIEVENATQVIQKYWREKTDGGRS